MRKADRMCSWLCFCGLQVPAPMPATWRSCVTLTWWRETRAGCVWTQSGGRLETMAGWRTSELSLTEKLTEALSTQENSCMSNFKKKKSWKIRNNTSIYVVFNFPSLYLTMQVWEDGQWDVHGGVGPSHPGEDGQRRSALRRKNHPWASHQRQIWYQARVSYREVSCNVALKKVEITCVVIKSWKTKRIPHIYISLAVCVLFFWSGVKRG